MDYLIIPELNTPFIFKSRPEAIPGDLRPLWRIGILLLMLYLASRGGKSSFKRLHVLNSMIRTSENRETLKKLIAGSKSPDAVVIRIEPYLNRAVDLAHGEGLVNRISGDRISLTPKGEALAMLLQTQSSIFVKEKEFLMAISKSLTERLVDSLFTGRY